LLNENVKSVDLPVIFTPQYSRRIGGRDCPTKELIYGGLEKSNGSKAFVYWNSTDMITVQGYEGTVTFEVPINAEVIEVEFLSNYWTSNRVVFTVE
jgi:hypothetical protein